MQGGRGSLGFSARSCSHPRSFPASSWGSPVYFHQPELAVGFLCVCRHERLFLLLEALLGKEGCVAVIYAGLGRFSRRGRGLGEDRLLPAVADPMGVTPALPLPRNLFPHSATRRPATTFLEKDHTCAYSSLWRRGGLKNRPAFPKLLSSSPVPESQAFTCRLRWPPPSPHPPLQVAY